MGRLIGSHRPPPRSGGRHRQGRHCAGCARPARTGSIASRWTAGGSSAARGRTGRRPRYRPTGPRAGSVSVGRGRPSTTRSAISTRRRVPIRHGMVLPHASPAQKRVSSRARSTMQARSSATTTEPEPMWAPAARSVSKAYGVSSRSGGSRPPDGPPTRTALIERLAGNRPPSPMTSRNGVPSGTSAMPSPDGVRTWTRIVPGLSGVPIAANAAAPLRMIHGTAARVWTLWTRVGMPIEAALGRVRRPLLGLAALALEGLQQDGLLAEHVGALDRTDRDRDVHPGTEDVEADEARLGRGADRRTEPRDGGRGIGPDRDDHLAGTDREGGDRRALDDRVRVVLEQEGVRAGRRVRAVAVDHDVAARRPPCRRPAAISPRPGSRRRRDRAARTTRSWRSSRSRRSCGSSAAARRTRPPAPPRRGRSDPRRRPARAGSPASPWAS